MEAAFVRFIAPVLPLLFGVTGRIAAFLATYALHSTVLIGAAMTVMAKERSRSAHLLRGRFQARCSHVEPWQGLHFRMRS